MRRFGLSLAALLFFVVCVVWKTPSWVLVSAIKQQLPPGAALGPTSGNIWRGKMDSLAYAGLQVSDLEWQLRPLGMVSGAPLSVSIKRPLSLNAELGASKQGTVVIKRLEAEGGVSELLSTVGFPSMGFDGRVSADLNAELGPKTCQKLEGKLVLRSLSGDVQGIESLVPVTADLRCQGTMIYLTVDQTSPVTIRGTINVPMGGMPRGNLTLSPAANSPLFESLQMFLGRPRNNKDFVLRF